MRGGNPNAGGATDDPIYTTLSDIVLYSGALQELAKPFVGAVEHKRKEECKGLDGPNAVAPLEYHVFVLVADACALRKAEGEPEEVRKGKHVLKVARGRGEGVDRGEEAVGDGTAEVHGS
ncbi:hypothetical protein B0H14DRAFT_2583191 [Mycena olivaceomarginata]|nr:hypothetical protein B0H14DRAFT_2583191 [Mycena olivaceomarginata]